MFSDFRKAIAQLLTDGRIRRVLIRSILLTVSGIILLSIGAAFLIPWVVGVLSALFGYDVSSIGWLNWTVGGVSGAGVLLMSFLLFPSLSAMISSIFLDEISEAVEARYYPGLPPARKIPLMETVFSSLRFAFVSFALNLLCLPLYLILLFVGIGPLIYWALNGYLLSREFYEQAAFRRLYPKKATEIRRRNRNSVWLEGVGLAILGTIPLANLVMPIVGTASMTHFVQRKRLLDTDSI